MNLSSSAIVEDPRGQVWEFHQKLLCGEVPAEMVEDLAHLIGDGDDGVRFVARESLRKLGDPGTLAAARLLRSREAAMRVAAAEALGDLGHANSRYRSKNYNLFAQSATYAVRDCNFLLRS